jgi:ArsR family transcriptional regulator
MENRTRQLLARLKALSDPVRLRLVALLAQGECSVSELTRVLGLSQPRVSQHLRALVESGMIERFRDGHFVYYRVPSRGTSAAERRRLLDLLPDDEPEFARDIDRLRELRADSVPAASAGRERPLHRALVELTVAAPLGDLLDIGCGRGSVLKLLASRARRAVGVDIDADARRFARAELLLAGLPNCTLRKGDMYELPFEDAEFDTVILDDVLGAAERPADVVAEASRQLRPSGRLLLLAATDPSSADEVRREFVALSRGAGLRLATPRSIPLDRPRWLLAVATAGERAGAAA